MIPMLRSQLEAAIKSATWVEGNGAYHGTSASWLFTLFPDLHGAATSMSNWSGTPADTSINQIELPADFVAWAIAWAKHHLTDLNNPLNKKNH